MTKSNRLLSLVEHYAGGNKSQFARKIGVSPQAITTWLARDTFDIERIYAKCEDVSAHWLITGEGPMMNSKYDDTSVSLLVEKLAEQAEKIGELQSRLRDLAQYVR